MKLSIITINYNNNEGLRKTVQSVLSQSFRDFEYIIVDGASSDGSVSSIEELTCRHTAFSCSWISEPDTGIYNAMNKGILRAQGEYLLFLNSGDYLVGNHVLESVFSQECTGDLLCARCYVSEKGRRVWTSPLVPEHITVGWLYFNGLMHQSTFIRRSLFETVGMYDESFRWLADIQFWYKALIFHDATSQPINVVVSDYNHEGQSSTTKGNHAFREEAHWQDRQPVLRHVIPDYRSWKKKNEIVNEFGWIQSHPHLRSFLSFYKKVFRKLNRIVKKK